MQLIVIFNLASLNHETLAFLKSQSKTFDHFASHKKLFEASSDQKASGSLTDSLYN